MFVDREDEIKALKKELEKDEFSLITITGRRRVGKTTLVKMTVNKGIYFYVYYGDEKIVKNELIKKLHASGVNIHPLASWEEIFREVMERNEILILDEFQRFLRVQPSVPSILQGVIDDIKYKSKAKIVLLGSSIGMMEKMFSYAGALYGRRTLNINLKPLKFRYAQRFFNTDFKNRIRLYSMSGGTPGYLEKFSKYSKPEDALKDIISKKIDVWDDPPNMIISELGKSTVYFSILKAIADGKTRFSEISNYVSIKPNALEYYLQNLIKNLALIRKVYPWGTKGSRKNVRYEISDPFFAFWFRFVYPFLSYIEEGNMLVPLEYFKQNFESYVGKVFEDIVREELSRNYAVYRWWLKGEEIDAVVKFDKEVILCEIKWSDKNLSAQLTKLKKKAEKYFENARLIIIVPEGYKEDGIIGFKEILNGEKIDFYAI